MMVLAVLLGFILLPFAFMRLIIIVFNTCLNSIIVLFNDDPKKALSAVSISFISACMGYIFGGDVVVGTKIMLSGLFGFIVYIIFLLSKYY